VDIAWHDGRVTEYRLRSGERKEVTVRVNGAEKTVSVNELGKTFSP